MKRGLLVISEFRGDIYLRLKRPAATELTVSTQSTLSLPGWPWTPFLKLKFSLPIGCTSLGGGHYDRGATEGDDFIEPIYWFLIVPDLS